MNEVRAFLKDLQSSVQYWAETLRQVAHIYNRLTSLPLKFKSSHESLLEEVPNSSEIRLLGCAAYLFRQKEMRYAKPSDYSNLGIKIGTRNGLFRSIFQGVNKVIKSRHVPLDKTVFPRKRHETVYTYISDVKDSASNKNE